LTATTADLGIGGHFVSRRRYGSLFGAIAQIIASTIAIIVVATK